MQTASRQVSGLLTSPHPFAPRSLFPKNSHLRVVPDCGFACCLWWFKRERCKHPWQHVIILRSLRHLSAAGQNQSGPHPMAAAQNWPCSSAEQLSTDSRTPVLYTSLLVSLYPDSSFHKPRSESPSLHTLPAPHPRCRSRPQNPIYQV